MSILKEDCIKTGFENHAAFDGFVEGKNLIRSFLIDFLFQGLETVSVYELIFETTLSEEAISFREDFNLVVIKII